MADSSSQDKNLPPSARKLKKAREDGQVARSRDLGHFVVIAASTGLFAALAPSALHWLQTRLAAALRFDVGTLASTGAMTERLTASVAQMLWIVLPLGLLVMVLGVATNVISGGWTFSKKAMAPQFSRMNPIKGLPRIFSKQQLGTTGKSALLALLLLLIGLLYLRANIYTLSAALALPLPAAFAAIGRQLITFLGLMVLALALFAAVDVPLQRVMHRSRLKMSHQEMKDEFKELEGNQEVKAAAKARMREMTNRRMMAAVPGASVVVMNPTHYAVALKYEDGMNAPRVVAKGVDLLALRIRDAAKAAEVPVLEAPPLARALYAHADMDREIPMALYNAVAQVLAHVFQLRAALSGRAPRPSDLPDLQVPPELDPGAAA